MNEYIMTIDPGTAHMGIALWDTRTWADGTKVGAASALKSYMSLETKGKPEKWSQVDAMCRAFTTLLGNDPSTYEQIIEVHVECPSVFLSCARGVAAVSDVLDTMLICGFIKGVIIAANTFMVPVTEWKGNLPKKVCNQRVIDFFARNNLPLCKTSTHALDAIGVGLHVQGAFEW